MGRYIINNDDTTISNFRTLDQAFCSGGLSVFPYVERRDWFLKLEAFQRYHVGDGAGTDHKPAYCFYVLILNHIRDDFARKIKTARI